MEHMVGEEKGGRERERERKKEEREESTKRAVDKNQTKHVNTIPHN